MIDNLKRLIVKISSEYCGPDVIGSISDMVIVFFSIVGVLLAFFLCIKYIFRPGESDPQHIKRTILSENDE